VIAVGSLCLFSSISVWHFSTKSGPKVSVDDVLLSLIKNDLAGFKAYINAGGDLQNALPHIDGQSMTVAQGMAYFERQEFIKYLQDQKKKFLIQDSKGDMLSITVRKNNAEILNLLLKESPDLTLRYGSQRMSLLHLASNGCSHKLVLPLMQTEKFKWNEDTKQGHNALTLAAENECLSLLSFWKKKGISFNKNDRRGISAFKILSGKKDATILDFIQSFASRSPASIAVTSQKTVTFYRKRINPKDMPVDYSALIEPESRPEAAVETAEKSEFSD